MDVSRCHMQPTPHQNRPPRPRPPPHRAEHDTSAECSFLRSGKGISVSHNSSMCPPVRSRHHHSEPLLVGPHTGEMTARPFPRGSQFGHAPTPRLCPENWTVPLTSWIPSASLRVSWTVCQSRGARTSYRAPAMDPCWRWRQSHGARTSCRAPASGPV